MKRLFSSLIILILLLSVTGCQKSTQNTVSESPDVIAAYNIAAEAYDWFDMTTMPLDTADSRQEDGSVYYRVEMPGITSMSELKTYLNTLFAPELTESLLNSSPGHYKDVEGVLYAQSADRGSNLYLQDKHVEASRKDDTHWEVTITFYADYKDNSDPAAPQVTIGYSQSVLDYERTDVGWRFTSFCPADNLNLKADTIFKFTYGLNAFDSTDFSSYSDFQLCCYLINADGAFAEGPSDMLAKRFLKSPENVVSALSIVEKSPWQNKDFVIPDVGYVAAAWFTDEERTEFEEILNSDTAARSDAERAVLGAISDAYKKSMAEREANKVKPEQEFSLAPVSEDAGHNTLQLGLQAGKYPWGFVLSGTPQAISGGDTYGRAYLVDCGNLTLLYTESGDGQQYLYSMMTTAVQPGPIWTRRGVYCGYSEKELKQIYPDELTYLDANHINPSYNSIGVEYDGAWVYEPGGEAACKHILFFMKDGVVIAIEVADLMDSHILN